MEIIWPALIWSVVQNRLLTTGVQDTVVRVDINQEIDFVFMDASKTSNLFCKDLISLVSRQ